MMPDDTNVSAFAAYTGKVSPSKSQKRRMKIKQRKSLDQSLSKLDKMEIIRSKKQKKESILNSKGKNVKLSDNKIFNKVNALAQSNKKLLTKTEADTKPMKKKKIVTGNVADMPKSSKKKKVIKKEIKTTISHINGGSKKNFVSNPSENSACDDFMPMEGITHAKHVGFLENHLIIGEEVPSKTDQINGDTKSKKAKIVTAEANFKKVVVSTPRFKRNAEKIKNKFTSDGDQNSSNVLRKVDLFLNEKRRTDLILQNSEKGILPQDKKSYTLIQLAERAKGEVQKLGSSEACGKVALEMILDPYNLDSFFKDNWEKKPLHIIGKRKDKFSQLISTEVIDSVLRDNVVFFGKHLDVTVYADGKRETHNTEGRANAHVVWDFYANGCSVRLLNPQYFINTVHTLNAALQEYFGCFVGANVYLTPPNSQGFAPHFDDIEAFILQVEGSKLWKIYEPITKDGYLPRFSSRNLTEEEIGSPVMEVKLNAGDVLYFPRGYIHQGSTQSEHSLHITLSVYQRTAWCDLLEKLLPLTLKKAASSDVEFRRGLPIGYLKSGGLAHTSTDMRKQVVGKLKKLVNRLNEFLETDAALDQMGLSFIQDALPPVLSASEAACSVSGSGWRMGKNGHLMDQINFSFNTSVRWIRAYCYRILEEDVTLEDGSSIERQIRIYHTLDNSREYHKEEPQFIILPPDMLPLVQHLSAAYPKFTKISDLPGNDDDEKLTLVGDLWDRGLLMTESPLEIVTEENVEEKNELLTKEEMIVVADLEDVVPDEDNNSSDSVLATESENDEDGESEIVSDVHESGEEIGDNDEDGSSCSD